MQWNKTYIIKMYVRLTVHWNALHALVTRDAPPPIKWYTVWCMVDDIMWSEYPYLAWPLFCYHIITSCCVSITEHSTAKYIPFNCYKFSQNSWAIAMRVKQRDRDNFSLITIHHIAHEKYQHFCQNITVEAFETSGKILRLELIFF